MGAVSKLLVLLPIGEELVPHPRTLRRTWDWGLRGQGCPFRSVSCSQFTAFPSALAHTFVRFMG